MIAGLAGITVDYLYQLERGKKVPALPVLLALAGALRVPIAALLGEEETSSSGTVTVAGGEALHRAMTASPRTAGPVGDLAQARAAVNTAWRTWQSSPHRYSTVGGLLPEPVTYVEALRHTAAGPQAREAERVAADVYGLTRSVAKRSGRIDLAVIAADRGRVAAENAEDPVRAAVACRNQAHGALRGGSGAAPAAVHGALLLVASAAATRRGDA